MPRAFVADARRRPRRRSARRAGGGDLGDAVRDEVEDVEPRDALRFEQPRRVRLRLLEDRRQDVAGMDFGALRALHVQHGRLQHAPERRRLLGLALLAAAQLFHRAIEVSFSSRRSRGRSAPQPFRIRSPSGVVRERVQQVLEREVGVPPRHRLAVGNRQDDFDRGGKHLRFLFRL